MIPVSMFAVSVTIRCESNVVELHTVGFMMIYIRVIGKVLAVCTCLLFSESASLLLVLLSLRSPFNGFPWTIVRYG
jgi:hypothetical protein